MKNNQNQNSGNNVGGNNQPKLNTSIKSLLINFQIFIKKFNESGEIGDIEFLHQSSLGKRLASNKQIRKIIKPVTKALENRLRYFRDFIWVDYAKTYRLIRQFWKTGILGRISLITLFVGTTEASYVILQNNNATTVTTGISPIILFSGLTVFALGWAFVLASIHKTSIYVYFLVCAYLSWYGLLIGVGLIGTIWQAIPLLWMLIVASKFVEKFNKPGEWILFFTFCVGCSFLSNKAFSLNKIFTGSLSLVGPGLLSLAYFCFAILISRIRFLKQIPNPKFPTTGLVFGGTFIITIAFFFMAWVNNITDLSNNFLTSMQNLLGIIDIFWMWLGAGLFKSALQLGFWNTEEITRIFPARFIRILVPIIWVIALILGGILTYPSSAMPMSILMVFNKIGINSWVNSWPDSIYFTIQAQVYLTLIVLGIAIFCKLFKKLSLSLLSSLNAVWIGGFIAVLGYYELLYGFTKIETKAALPANWWFAFVLISGLILQVGKAAGSIFKTESNIKVYGITSILLFMLAISIITFGTGLPELIIENSFYTFQGVVYLSIPIAFYVFFKKYKIFEPQNNLRLIGFIALGCLSAVPALVINPYAGTHLWIVPVIWSIIILLSKKISGKFDHWMEGAFAGGALAFGFTFYWMSPEIIPVPFLEAFYNLQKTYTSIDLVELNRPFLRIGHFWLVFIAVIAGILLGVALTRKRRILVFSAAILLASASFSFIIPSLPGIPISAPVKNPVINIPNSPEINIPKDWNEKQLGKTQYFVMIPPNWIIDTPNQNDETLTYITAPDKSSYFSIQLLSTIIDINQLIEDDINVNKGVFNDFILSNLPNWQSNNKSLNWVQMEGISTSSKARTLNAYMSIKEGTLAFSLLSSDNSYWNNKQIIYSIIASLFKK